MEDYWILSYDDRSDDIVLELDLKCSPTESIIKQFYHCVKAMKVYYDTYSGW